MRSFPSKAVTIVVGFLHDFAAGFWVACLLLTYWLEGQKATSEVVATLQTLQQYLFYSALVAIGIIFASGFGRTFTYVENVYGEEAEKLRRHLLIYKHVVLLPLFGVGTYWQYSLAF